MGPKQVMEWAEKKINGGVALTEEDSVDVHVVVRCMYMWSPMFLAPKAEK